MAGHSHASNVKHRKNAVDAKRAKIFSKLARNIISAVRQGGAEIDTNLKLKYAVEKARAANMPKDNIQRAIKRGEGSKDGDDFEELVYEGYAPGGVAILVRFQFHPHVAVSQPFHHVNEPDLRGGRDTLPIWAVMARDLGAQLRLRRARRPVGDRHRGSHFCHGHRGRWRGEHRWHAE